MVSDFKWTRDGPGGTSLETATPAAFWLSHAAGQRLHSAQRRLLRLPGRRLPQCCCTGTPGALLLCPYQFWKQVGLGALFLNA